MNSTFERNGEKSTVEWYTPPYIIEALGGWWSFDLDPASPENIIIETACKYYNKRDNDLAQSWNGRVFLNPPYENPLIGQFMQKLAEHGNGIALVYNRTDSKWCQEYVLKKADAILFLSKRIKFIKPDGSAGNSPGAGSILIAYGQENVKYLEDCGLEGCMLYPKK
jgi:hypothetical protein